MGHYKVQKTSRFSFPEKPDSALRHPVTALGLPWDLGCLTGVASLAFVVAAAVLVVKTKEMQW